MRTRIDPAVAAAAATAKVAGLRGGTDVHALADALEELATAATEDVELGTAAAALEEAAGLWAGLDEPGREGSCLLLAATTRRLAGDPGAARHDLDRAAASPGLTSAVRHALDAERGEQALAAGDAGEAWRLFGTVLDVLDDERVRARLLQRRAAAAVAGERWRDAATDLMDAEALFTRHGEHADAESCALGAAVAIAHEEPDLAEEMWAAVAADAPAGGAAAATRHLTGGEVALLAGDARRALARFDAARRGALDAVDPFAYLTAVARAVAAAEVAGDDAAAYARLATAWATVGDLLGEEAGRNLVRPQLAGLRDRLGPERFAKARAAYEEGPG